MREWPCFALRFGENQIDVVEPVDVRLFEFLLDLARLLVRTLLGRNGKG